MTEIEPRWKSECGETFNYDSSVVSANKGRFFFVLADGVGRSRLSGLAAWMAVVRINYMMKGLKEKIEEENWRTLIDNSEGITCNRIYEILKEGISSANSEQELKATMNQAIKIMNRKIYKLNKNATEIRKQALEEKQTFETKNSFEVKSYAKPGTTTIDLGVIYNNKLYVSHVGDCRVYILKKDGTFDMTKDETEAYVFYEQGIIKDKEEVKVHPSKSGLNNALGSKEDIKPVSYEWQLNGAKAIFAATDGLYCNITDAEIYAALNKSNHLEDKVEMMFSIAKNPVGIQEIVKKNKKYRIASDDKTGIIIELRGF